MLYAMRRKQSATFIARQRRYSHGFYVTAFKQGTKVLLSVEHKLAPLISVLPKTCTSLFTGSKAIVCSANDSIVFVKGNCTNLPEWILAAS
jgi:hypothetical protein